MTQLPFPVRTDRLLIRFFEPRDRDLELAIQGDERLFVNLPIDPRTEAEIDETLAKRVGVHSLADVGAVVSLAVETAETARPVGAVQLVPSSLDPVQLSMGWLALHDQQGNGYMTEALRAILRVVFADAEVHRVTADIMVGNEASVRLAERLGFRKEAHFVRSIFARGEWRDELVYALLADDWIA